MQAADLTDALKRTYLMSGLTDEQVKQIETISNMHNFEGGDTIIRQFSKDSDLIIVIEGQVRINTFSGEKIAEAGPGSVIGEMSLIDDKPRSATVVSMGRARVAVIPSVKLWELMREDAHLARLILLNISRILSTRLRAANIQLDLGVRK
jgi:CRP-like cAMP-binding protein